MGIRYYAYPIVAADVSAARAQPYRFLGKDPLMDAWGPLDERPNMLYLDTCWRYLQRLLARPVGHPPRPGLRLVIGEVIDTADGWIPHLGVLEPDDVVAAAEDLATVTEDDIHRLLNGPPTSPTRPEDFAYIAHFLAQAREVTAEWAESGFGLVYMIG